MALTVHAVDGLINRLLQQQHSSAAQRRGDTKQGGADAGEHVNISGQARQIAVGQPAPKLASDLLQLYSPRNI